MGHCNNRSSNNLKVIRWMVIRCFRIWSMASSEYQVQADTPGVSNLVWFLQWYCISGDSSEMAWASFLFAARLYQPQIIGDVILFTSIQTLCEVLIPATLQPLPDKWVLAHCIDRVGILWWKPKTFRSQVKVIVFIERVKLKNHKSARLLSVGSQINDSPPPLPHTHTPTHFL